MTSAAIVFGFHFTGLDLWSSDVSETNSDDVFKQFFRCDAFQ